jgi:predicted outer membrane repeat protein
MGTEEGTGLVETIFIINITSTNITNNTAKLNGGGIYCNLPVASSEHNSELVLTNGLFESNLAQNGAGGAVSSSGAINLNARSTCFMLNSASTMGGAVASTVATLPLQHQQPPSMVLNSCSFWGNLVTGQAALGGAVAHAAPELEILNQEVTNCTNPSWTETNCPADCEMESFGSCFNCKCSVSQPGEQGISKKWPANASSCTFNSTVFSNNSADSSGSSGGAVSLANVAGMFWNSSISGCSAAVGGGINLEEGMASLYLHKTHMLQNQALLGPQIHSSSEGAINLASGSSIHFAGPGLAMSVEKASDFGLDSTSHASCAPGAEFTDSSNISAPAHLIKSARLQCNLTSDCIQILRAPKQTPATFFCNASTQNFTCPVVSPAYLAALFVECYKQANHKSCLHFPNYTADHHDGDGRFHASWCDACNPQYMVPTFTAKTVDLYCIACSAGNFSSAGGKLTGNNSLKQTGGCIKCPKGKFQNESSGKSCRSCGEGQVSTTNGSVACQVCQALSYANGAHDSCETCPNPTADAVQPFSCLSGKLEFRPNFWHDGLNYTEHKQDTTWKIKEGYIVNSATQFYSCPSTTCCNVTSTTGGVNCSAGYNGLLCSQCDQGYYKKSSTGSCIKCGDDGGYQWLFVVVSVVLAILLVMYWYWKIPGCRKLKLWIARGVCCPVTLQKYAVMPRLGRLWNSLVFSYKTHWKTKFKLAVSFYQVSSLLHSSYQVPYPYEYLHFMDQTKYLSVDATKYAFPAASCIPEVGPISFATKLYSLGIVACVIYAGAWALIKSSGKKAWAQKALPWLSIVLFLLYPSLTTVFFDALKCRVIDGQPYVMADLSVMCTGEEYTPVHAVSWVLVVLWACGLPAIATGLLWPARSELREGDSPEGFQKHLKGLYSQYKPSWWFFEAVEYTKKLLLVGIIPAISSSEGSYLAGAVAALLITNMHVALLLALTPFANKADQFLAVGFNALLSITILLSILLKIDQVYLSLDIGNGLDPGTVSGFLIGSNVLVVVMSVGAYCISTWQDGLLKASHAMRVAEEESFNTGTLQEELLDPIENEQGAHHPPLRGVQLDDFASSSTVSASSASDTSGEHTDLEESLLSTSSRQ